VRAAAFVQRTPGLPVDDAHAFSSGGGGGGGGVW